MRITVLRALGKDPAQNRIADQNTGIDNVSPIGDPDVDSIRPRFGLS